MQDIQSISIFKKIENQYRALIHHLDPDPAKIIQLSFDLENAYLKILKEIKIHRRFTASSDHVLTGALGCYSDHVRQLHRQNMDWISLYADFCWPVDGCRLSSKKKNIRDQYRVAAQAAWQSLEKAMTEGQLSRRENGIMSLKSEFEREPPHSAQWRLLSRQLSRAIYDIMVKTLIENRYELNNLFCITICTWQDKSLRKTGHNIDIVRGYVYQAKEKLEQLFRGDSATIGVPLKRCFSRRRVNVWMKSAAVAVIIFCFSGILRFSGLDERLWSDTVFAVQKFLKKDPKSMARKEKEAYFRRQILEFDRATIEDRINDNVHQFIEQKMYTSLKGIKFFTDHILKDFLFALSDWELDPHVKQEALTASLYLGTDVARPLHRIVDLYQHKTIRESELRDEMLNLRRGFIQYNIFVFMFLTLHDEVPHIFLYPEKIFFRYVLSDKAMERLGLDWAYYDQYVELPIIGHVVSGATYPFKDRAGYFEGEFAVVLASLTDNQQWTGHHEIGHVVDYVRDKHMDIKMPDNVEVNAMLYPMIFSKERKEYVQRRLVGRLRQPRVHDYYSQAAKGILNGILLYRKGTGSEIRNKMITNRFEQTRIDYIAQLVADMESDDVRQMATELFRYPEGYLDTAEAGKYLSVMTDTGEIIKGVHGVAQRGFVINDGWGEGLTPKGPRFIKDGTSEEESLDVPFDLMSFIKSIIRIAIFHREGLATATKAEAVAAAVVVFVVFESLAILLHFLSGPIRRRFYHGVSVDKLVDKIYKDNPWSKGVSYGEQINERQLLKKIFSSQGPLDQSLKDQIISFKAVSDDRTRLLFDLCLCLAVRHPRKSLVTNKAHDLLFYLPFAGPYIARSKFIFKVQKHFHNREHYNAEVVRLVLGIESQTLTSEVLNRLVSLIERYGLASQAEAVSTKGEQYFEQLEGMIFDAISDQQKVARMKEKWIIDRRRHAADVGSEFDHLDKYYPGDDIRRIDWNVTARSVTREAIIRKYTEPHTIHVAFLMDMRFLDREKVRRKWAHDFIRSINMIGREQVLEQFIFLLKNGTILDFKVRVNPLMNTHRSAKIIFDKVRQTFSKTQAYAGWMQSPALNFYTDEENQDLSRQLDLTDFAGEHHPLQYRRISRKGMNIFSIGGTINSRDELAMMVPDGSQLINWEHVSGF